MVNVRVPNRYSCEFGISELSDNALESFIDSIISSKSQISFADIEVIKQAVNFAKNHYQELNSNCCYSTSLVDVDFKKFYVYDKKVGVANKEMA